MTALPLEPHTEEQAAHLARIDAAAQAIVIEAYDRQTWAQLDESARNAFRRYARAAIAAPVAQAGEGR